MSDSDTLSQTQQKRLEAAALRGCKERFGEGSVQTLDGKVFELSVLDHLKLYPRES